MASVASIAGFGQAVRVLDAWLLKRNYTQWSRENIARYLERTGELSGAVGLELLDAEDEAEATETLIAALPSEPMASREWDDESIILDVQMMIDMTHPLPFGPEPPDAPDAGDHCRFPGAATLAARKALAAAGIAPIAGGAPDDAAPLDGDRADFEAWLSQVDRPYPPAAQAPRDLRPESLGSVAAALFGPNPYA